MNEKLDTRPHWNTSSFGSPAHTSPVELAALGEHLNRCVERRGLRFKMRCMADALTDFAAPRVMTILAVVAVLGVTVSLLA